MILKAYSWGLCQKAQKQFQTVLFLRVYFVSLKYVCHGLNVCVPSPNSYVKTLTSSVIVFGYGPLGGN